VNLLCLTHSLSDVDGVGRYGTEILRRVAPRFERVRVLIARKHRGLSPRLPDGLDVRVALPPDYFLYLSWPKFLVSLVAGYKRVLRAAADADLIHALSDYPHAMLGVLAARRLKKPVLVSGHGTYSVAPFRQALHRRMITWTYGQADGVLMGSRFALDRLLEQHPFPKARVVAYGVDPEQFEGAERRPLPAGTPARYVLTIGEVKERKGHHVSVPAFLSAARRHPDVHLVVIGRFVAGDPYFEERQREIAAAGLADRVHFVGLVSEEEKLALLAHAEVFLLTPVTSSEGGFEAFGLVFLEANACGVPTVGIRDSGAQDAIKDGETGFLADAGDTAGVAARLDRLLGDAPLRRRLGEAGRTWARDNDWDRAGAEIAASYDALLSARTSRVGRVGG
jgi:phosphatidylinositol alpha-1,6-mannosyltransferase